MLIFFAKMMTLISANDDCRLQMSRRAVAGRGMSQAWIFAWSAELSRCPTVGRGWCRFRPPSDHTQVTSAVEVSSTTSGSYRLLTVLDER